MLQSPAKRRRLNGSTITGEGSDNIDSPHLKQPVTPTRASYLSPTRSSLSRSHPHLINKTATRSSAGPRGKSLRDEILRPPSKTSVRAEPLAVADNADESERRANETQTALHVEPKTTIEANQSNVSQTSRSSLRQPPYFDQTRPSPHSDEDTLPEMFKPALVPKPIHESGAETRERSEEIELPPTPVQLGVTTQPDRPRGLASSSSPRGSKLGSGRRRRRRTDGPITSSPLKPRHADRAAADRADLDLEQILADEAQESEADDTQDVEPPPTSAVLHQEDEVDSASAETSEKQAVLQKLLAELEKLKMEVDKLDAAVEKDQIDDSIMSLLFQSPGVNHDHDNTLPSSATDEENATQYLALFSPGDLRLSSSTETKKIHHRTKIIHSLTLTAPPPWPVHAAMFAFEITVDAEDARVEQVSRKRISGLPRSNGRPTGIHRWVSQRLDHPLHWHDVGGIVWGLGQWFRASIERARIFQQLDQRPEVATSISSSKATDSITEREAITLAPYLNQIQIQLQQPRAANTTNKLATKKKILLVWDINIDWTGEVKSDISISVSGVSAKASRGLKEIFGGLVPNQGVVKALEHVSGLLHGGGDDNEDGTDPPAREKARRKKRKRVVLV
ncbi:hypothetical protein LTR84_008550 [Exophiala bonariae]|uniref:Uncharacterized protein n=1 Tax=Exophiala bonariae TaxID=1690606 RepID=A0AAV9MZV6_9EURO|nr:hypothetical protein LTR84_008550 [Exophiala bonariae]